MGVTRVGSPDWVPDCRCFGHSQGLEHGSIIYNTIWMTTATVSPKRGPQASAQLAAKASLAQARLSLRAKCATQAYLSILIFDGMTLNQWPAPEMLSFPTLAQMSLLSLLFRLRKTAPSRFPRTMS
jgi:hypothetical protein